tara:strand:+ start:1589 stop:1915 length:327 start_codon:yes stop_codon:yes gene_type:complete
MTTFTEWFKECLGEYADDIANHGADAGYPHISYTSDTVEIYNRFEDEIYEWLNEDAESFGHQSPDELIATFGRKDMLSWPDGRKNLLVWYACERLAHQIVDEHEEASQ